MFGWLKRKGEEVRTGRGEVVSQAANESAKFMLDLQAALGGFPRTMLDDPFIIGATAMYAAITIKVMTNGQAPNTMVEAAMTEAVERAFLGKGVARHDAIGALIRFKNDPEYAKAVQVVTLILAARYERKDMVHDPLISEAKASIASMPQVLQKQFGDTEAEQVAYELSRRLFIAPLKKKYGELWRTPGNA
jgi:hypothetical protein